MIKSSKWFFMVFSTVFISLAVVITFFYWPSFFYPFQFDDNLAILKQFSIRLPGFFDHFLTNSRWVGNWINSLNFAFGKFDPFIFRVTNIIIHIILTWGVFLLSFLLLQRTQNISFTKQYSLFISIIVAFLFGLHPVQTQTVSYVIQGRLEGLSALFIIYALICFIVMTQVQLKLARSVLGLAIFSLLFFAYGTKEISIVAPILFVLVDWFFVAQGNWSEIKKRWGFYGLLMLLTAGVYFYFKRTFILQVLTFSVPAYNNVGNVLTDSVTAKIDTLSFMLSQFKVIVHYISIFFWPFNMSVEYDWKLVHGFFDIDCLLPLLALGVLGYCIGYLLKQNKVSLFCFGILWFFVCILPRSTIIPSPELLVDYKTYLASYGLFLVFASAIVYSLVWIAKRFLQNMLYKKIFYAFTVLVIVLGFGLLTLKRNTVWSSDIIFWENIICNAPQKARAYNNYGIALIQANRCQEAIFYLKKALSLQHGHYWDPFTNLSIAYSHLGEIDMAIESIKQAIKINRYHPESYNSLGLLFEQKNKFDDAQKSFEVAIRLRPHYGKARFNLGQLFVKKHEYEKAWDCFKLCCMEDDFDTVPDGFLRYATLSMHLDKLDDAITGYTKLVELDPLYPDAQLNLGNAYYLAKKFDQALIYYRKAADLQPQDFRPLANSAQIYIKLKQPDLALNYLKKARDLPHAPKELELKIAHCFKLMGQDSAAEYILKQLADQNVDKIIQKKAKELLN
ncbi:MAG TPA: tetratricopeptide repeat protein [Candidatus Babeliales bacterium]|nr:tetratricopeptide repeat protein [Candidatus Babeliales bacterium]